MKRMRNLILLGMWLSIPSVSHALEVFGNGNLADNANTSGFSFNAHNAWAVPFTPGASNLDQRTLYGAHVLVGGDPVSRTFFVSIYADAGSGAGPTGSALVTKSLTLGAGAPVDWQLVTFDTPFVLTASANYYLAVEESSASTDFLWRSPTNSPAYSNLGSGSSYQITGGDPSAVTSYGRIGSTWSSSGSSMAATPLGLQLVPEPSTYVLSGLGIIALALVRRKNRA